METIKTLPFIYRFAISNKEVGKEIELRVKTTTLGFRDLLEGTDCLLQGCDWFAFGHRDEPITIVWSSARKCYWLNLTRAEDMMLRQQLFISQSAFSGSVSDVVSQFAEQACAGEKNG